MEYARETTEPPFTLELEVEELEPELLVLLELGLEEELEEVPELDVPVLELPPVEGFDVDWLPLVDVEPVFAEALPEFVALPEALPFATA